jgi:hypothetical protein
MEKTTPIELTLEWSNLIDDRVKQAMRTAILRHREMNSNKNRYGGNRKKSNYRTKSRSTKKRYHKKRYQKKTRKH